MALLTERRVRAAAQDVSTRLRKSMGGVLTEAAKSEAESFDIFLSHSIKDAEIVLGTKTILEEEMGFSVYVDWIVDPDMKREQVTRTTARKLKIRMRNCLSLIYLHSSNSGQSKWMPWELGYFDGRKGGRVAILPVTQDARDTFEGQEYLGIYPYVDFALTKKRDEERAWVNRNADEYASLRAWISDPSAIRKRA